MTNKLIEENNVTLTKLWYTTNNSLVMKIPDEFLKNKKLPIKLERTVALKIRKDCIEIRNINAH